MRLLCRDDHGPCQRDHLPEYLTSEARLDRLEKIRRGLSGSWESALVLGDGNYLDHVYAPMVAGLIEIAIAAERLADESTDDNTTRLRRELTNYLRDVDAAKRAPRP